MRAGAGPPRAGPGVMPTPARRSRSAGGGGLGQAGQDPGVPSCPRPRAKLSRPAPYWRPGAAGDVWLRAGRAAGEAAPTHCGRGPLRVPLPPPRGCAHFTGELLPRRHHGPAGHAGAGPGGSGLRSARARPRRTKGRRAGRASPCRQPIRRRERVGGGAALPIAGPVGVARR